MSVTEARELGGPQVPALPRRAAVPRWLRHAGRVLLHLAADAAAITFAFWAAYRLRFHWGWWTARFPIQGVDPGWGFYAAILYTVVPLWLGILWYSCRVYTRPWLSPYDRFLQLVKGAFLGVLATLAATYIYSRLEYSRQMLLMAWPLAALALSFSHALVLKLDRLVARLERVSPLLLIGNGHVSELIRENVRARHPNVPIHELAQVPEPGGLLALARESGVAEVVLVRSDVDHARLLELAEACESADIGFRMIPDLLELRLGEIQMDESLGLPAYRLQHAQLTRSNYAAKRAFDLAFSLLILAVLGLPLLLIALVIRLDSKGPALYRQKRLGFKGRVFWAYKFRTMVVNAEAALAQVKDLNAQNGGFFKAKDDPRVTRAGKWLRRFSLDEFPQFLNVLKGEMSVVGPRPLAVATGEIEELVGRFGATAKKRLNALPGITGLWQVSGRSDISAEQRFALDMFYIEHWSLGLDLKIILKTIPAMLSAKGAY